MAAKKKRSRKGDERKHNPRLCVYLPEAELQTTHRLGVAHTGRVANSHVFVAAIRCFAALPEDEQRKAMAEAIRRPQDAA